MIELKVCNTTTEEAETTVSFGRKDDRAVIWTNDNTVVTKIQKCLNAEGTEWVLEETAKFKDGTIASYTFSCPKKLISFKPKRKAQRELTDEERQVLAERFKKSRGMTGDTVAEAASYEDEDEE